MKKKNHLFIADTNANSFKRSYAKRKVSIIAALSILFLALVGGTIFTSDVKAESATSLVTCAILAPAFVIRRKEDSEGGGGTESTVEEKALIQKINASVKELIEKSESATAIKELKAAFEQFKAAKSKEDYEKINTKLNELSLQLKELNEKPGNQNHQIKGIHALLTEKAEALKGMIENKSQSVQLSVKAAGTMTRSNVSVTGGGDAFILSEQEPGLTRVPRTSPFFTSLLNIGRTAKQLIRYVEMKNPDGGAGMTGEGGAKTQADFDLVETSATVKKVTSYIKVSKEALDDIEFLTAEINNELMELVELKADNQVLKGDGIGNNLKGVITYAQAFAAGDLANKIKDANNYDVLVAAILQVATAEVQSEEPAGFEATSIVLHPVDVTLMKLHKDANNNYVFPYYLPNSNKVMEVPIISNSRMTKGDFLVMDGRFANVRIREDVNINIGYENDDFTKNLVTILAEKRLVHYIKSNHEKAFVKGTFTTAKALLEKVVNP